MFVLKSALAKTRALRSFFSLRGICLVQHFLAREKSNYSVKNIEREYSLVCMKVCKQFSRTSVHTNYGKLHVLKIPKSWPIFWACLIPFSKSSGKVYIIYKYIIDFFSAMPKQQRLPQHSETWFDRVCFSTFPFSHLLLLLCPFCLRFVVWLHVTAVCGLKLDLSFCEIHIHIHKYTYSKHHCEPKQKGILKVTTGHERHAEEPFI